MVTIDKVGGSNQSKHTEIFGKSTDVKPTTNIDNGDVFMEMDTGVVWFFDGDTNTWISQS